MSAQINSGSQNFGKETVRKLTARHPGKNKMRNIDARYSAIALLLAVLAVAATPSWGTTLYSENFDSYAGGTALTAAPGWTSVQGDIVLSTNNPWGSMAIDGATSPFFVGQLEKTFAAATPSAQFEVTFDANVGLSINDFFGFSGGSGAFRSLLGYSVSANTWDWDNRFLGSGGAYQSLSAAGLGSIVTGRIVIDPVLLTASASITDGLSTLNFAPQSMASISTVSGVMLFNYREAPNVDGMDVDNILVTTVPEAGSVSLLAMGGLLAWIVRKFRA